MRTNLITARELWADRRWRLRLGAWAVMVLLAILLPYDGGAEGPGYLLGLMGVSVVFGVLDPRPLMSAAGGLVLASIARVVLMDAAYSPYVSDAADSWVAVELLVLPLAVIPPLMATWAIVTRRGAEPLAWIRLPGAGVAQDA